MVINIQETITDNDALAKRYIERDGFIFTTITYPENVFDAIVIKYPQDIPCASPCIRGSKRSLEEQISLINRFRIEKALIITERLDFITQCPTLEHLRIVPADTAGNGFDYTPLYEMPRIKSLQCATVYGVNEEFSTYIDCAKIRGIESLHVTDSGYQNYQTLKTLRSLGLSHDKNPDLTKSFASSKLDTLLAMQCKMKSLEGIERAQCLQCLYLYFNRSLQDIHALRTIKSSLRALRIENCPKITDFSVLGELENLELLELSGSNKLPNLDFLKTMKHLKTFLFSMDVQDGDLSPCMALSYVYSEKNRRHYHLRDADLPKGDYIRGNENIEVWRRLE